MSRAILPLVAVLTAALGIAAGAATARPSTGTDVSPNCLELTNPPRFNASSVTQGLGLTVYQLKEVRSRLSQYNSVRGFPGFAGIGLTPEQIATMKARIAAQVAGNARPLGWPCPAFKNRARTVAFVRALLVGNGFTTYSIRFYGSAPRQIQLSGTLNGIRYGGAVVRSGVRQITLQLTAPDNPGDTQVFATPFDA